LKRFVTRLAAVLGALLVAAALAGALGACGGDDEVAFTGAPRAGSEAEEADLEPAADPAPDESGAGRAPANGETAEVAGRADRSAGDPPAGPALDPRASAADARPPAAAAARPLVVFLGDSLTAGYGLPEADAYPALIAAALATEGRLVRVVNAGVSGDTSAGGLARLDWVLRLEPDVVVVELGPNDGLRGLPLEATEANLRRIVERARAAGARVLLAGMLIPPNYGPDYAGRFAAIYPRLAAELDVPLVPFLLEGVGGEPDLNLTDGIHPNAAGHRRMADNVLPYLRALVAETGSGSRLSD
jgi:acyl-CoA thioesterase-1